MSEDLDKVQKQVLYITVLMLTFVLGGIVATERNERYINKYKEQRDKLCEKIYEIVPTEEKAKKILEEMGLKIDIEGYKIGPNKESIPIKKVIELEK
jgi:hypothetical protein